MLKFVMAGCSDVNIKFFINPDIETLNPVKVDTLVHHVMEYRLYKPTTVAGLITGE